MWIAAAAVTAATIPIPDQLLGPFAALVGAIIVVGVLWREHLRADAEDRKQRDVAMAGWQAQVDVNRALVASTDKLVAQVDRLNTTLARRERRRRTDRP